MKRTEVVKALWQYIKANDLQDPSNRQHIILDSKLATIFEPPVTAFSMNKQLSKHIGAMECQLKRIGCCCVSFLT